MFQIELPITSHSNVKMKIDEYVAISGMPGLYEMINSKPGGMTIKNLDDGKVKFASVRKHNFNPIASIGIYVTTEEDTLNLKDVFKKMLESIKKNPLPDKKASNKDLTEYLAKVLPEYDQERVYPSDIKRLVKWFSFLNDRNLLSLEEEEESDDKKKKKKIETPEEKAKANKKAAPKKSAAKATSKKGASKMSMPKKSGK